MKKEKSCGCIIFNDNQEVLLIHMNAGHWSFPKGHVETGETEHETALRETYEETGIHVEILEGFRELTSYSPKPNIWKDVIFFVAKPISKEITVQTEELQSAGFYSYNEAIKKVTFEADKEILIKAQKFIMSS